MNCKNCWKMVVEKDGRIYCDKYHEYCNNINECNGNPLQRNNFVNYEYNEDHVRQ